MTATHSKKLVAALRKKRASEGLSIRALSLKIGVSFSTLARIERGEGEPDNNSTIRILNWLGDEALDHGLSYQHTAFVHFRAGKNISSTTVHCLLMAADAIKQGDRANLRTNAEDSDDVDQHPSVTLSLSKSEMEEMANNLRKELGVGVNDALDALSVRVHGVSVLVPREIDTLTRECLLHLSSTGKSEWSAMSVPMDPHNARWTVLRNDAHPIERQRVTYLEECWHILLGHKLTRIAKVADSYGRTYDSGEEHDAYYLASATLLPKAATIRAIETERSVKSIAEQYGVSTGLVEYRIKRLGLWRRHKGISVALGKSPDGV